MSTKEESGDVQNDELMKFMRKVLESYEEIRGQSCDGNIEFWDVVLITTADEDQRRVFQAQIDAKLERGELPKGIPYLITADPPGPKLGNGGSTLTALSYLYEKYSQSLFNKRILLIHAGGQSKRMPSTSVLGKIFSPLPYGNPIYQMLDFKLAMYMPFLPRMGPGIFVACADDMLVYNLGDIRNTDWSFAPKGFTVLGHPSTLAIGTKHGVYVVEDESAIDTMKHVQTIPCVEVLQKPTIERMKARKAILSRKDLKFPDGIKIVGQMAYTDSSFFFAMDVAKKLIKLSNELSPLDCEIDAYGDFLQALGPNATADYTEIISNVTSPTPSLIPTRQKVFSTLRDCNITLLVMNSSKFVHIGTTKEYIHHFCFDHVFQQELGLQKDVFNAWIESSKGDDGSPTKKKMKLSPISDGCVMHCALPADTYVSENTVVEYCDFDVPVDVGQNSIISNCSLLATELLSDSKADKFIIPHNVFLHTVPVKSREKTKFATVAFHIDDNLKKEVDASELETLPFLGYRVEDAFKFCHVAKSQCQGQGDVKSQDQAQGDLIGNSNAKAKFSLWNFEIFPVESTMSASLMSTLDLIKAVRKHDETICNLKNKDLVSMDTVLKRKDVMAMLDFREKLNLKINM